MWKIESLRQEHDRAGFDCGSEPLNLYLRQTARQHVERGISQTFVLVRADATPPKPISGFFSLCVCEVEAEEIPERHRKRMPRVVGAVRLGRLAVSLGNQRQGLGELMLGVAIQKCRSVFAEAGGIGLFVDAKDDAGAAYYEQFGFERNRDGGLTLFLPADSIADGLRKSS